MEETKDGFVLDCSVTMAWCFDDEATPYTDRPTPGHALRPRDPRLDMHCDPGEPLVDRGATRGHALRWYC